MRTISSHFSGPARTLSQSRRILKCEPVAGPFFVLGVVLLLCSAARADIECEATYEPHEPIVIVVKPTEVPEGAKLRGSLQVTDARYLQPNASEGVFYVWAGPGTHTITATGVWVQTQEVDVGGTKVPVLIDFGQYSYSKTFVVGKEDDDPNPPPPPPGTRWGLVLEETEQRTPTQGNLYLQLRKEFQDERLQIHDVTNLPPSLRALESQRPQNLTLPVLVVIARQSDGTDQAVRYVPLPSSVDAVKAEIAK